MFYVYELSDPDTGTVFYVGKGSKGKGHTFRWNAHIAEARKYIAGNLHHVTNAKKLDRIVDIIKRQKVPAHAIVFYSNDEEAAYLRSGL